MTKASLKMKIRTLMGVASFAAAIAVAFAFTPAKKAVSKTADHPTALVWVKYDCNNPGQVQIVTGGNTRTSADDPLFNDCLGETQISCARLYDEMDLEAVPDKPGNFQPKNGADIHGEEFCSLP